MDILQVAAIVLSLRLAGKGIDRIYGVGHCYAAFGR